MKILFKFGVFAVAVSFLMLEVSRARAVEIEHQLEEASCLVLEARDVSE